MSRFGILFDKDLNITMWDNLNQVPMTAGGEPMKFEAHEWIAADKIRFLMNQRVERPELTRADGKLVGV